MEITQGESASRIAYPKDSGWVADIQINGMILDGYYNTLALIKLAQLSSSRPNR